MKEIRLNAFIAGKLEVQRRDNKSKQIASRIEATRIDLQDELLTIECSLEDTTSKFADKDSSIDDILQEIANLLNLRKGIEEKILSLLNLEEYLFEEIEITTEE